MIRKHSTILLTLCLATVATAASQKTKDPNEASIQRARSLFAKIVAKDFNDFLWACDSSLAATMPYAMLEDTWRHIGLKFGAYEKELEASATVTDGVTGVTLTCQFADDAVDVFIAINSSNEAIALTFARSDRVEFYKTPEYVSTSSFKEVEVVVSAGKYELPATISIPKQPGPHSGVVLVHGSGPHDRDETIFRTKPFKDIAWGLASKGIVVLRYEKRTKAHPGAFLTQTPTIDEEVADDAVAAARLLLTNKEANVDKVFIVGHSLGATAAPYIASNEPKIHGIVMMAAAARPIHELVHEQITYLVNLDGEVSAPEQVYLDNVTKTVAAIKDGTSKDTDKLLGVPLAYWNGLSKMDLIVKAKGLTIPMLFMQGGRDYQVSPERDFDKLKLELGTLKNAEFKKFDRLDHLFHAGDEPSKPDDYRERGFVDGEVIGYLANWIRKQS